ncbi:GH12 family glycosyl hydrolase domain-containing protein [Stygiolobus azoricus]|uniref:Cellulase n=1 Tax=Stygiolobus azoricus TaxID=41675 RepID=A0A650CPG2_9CREN|nr:hypothetical protein [Stygiolobus azoricus]QGR19734.1 hypothetical protein D1868_06830 [Stygiolobus azoricus]
MKKGIIILVTITLLISSLALVLSNVNHSGKSYFSSSTNSYSAHSNSFTSSSIRINLMEFNTSFSLIGEKGPTLAYPIAEVYSTHNSLLASTFLWNIQSSDGVVNMTFKNGILKVSINLTNFKKIQNNIPVDGYPGLMYGREGWFPFYGSTIQLPQLTLPQKLDSLPKFYSEVDFKLYKVNGSIDDFSYDIWLTQDPNVTVLQYPSIEVMVWMYHEENISSQYFVKVGNVTVTAIINGSMENVIFDVYVLPHTGSSDGWIGVYYVSQEQLEGDITLPLSYLIKQSVYFASKIFPSLSPSQYYLNAIQVGMEFNNDPQGNANLGYELYGWYLIFNSTAGS